MCKFIIKFNIINVYMILISYLKIDSFFRCLIRCFIRCLIRCLIGCLFRCLFLFHSICHRIGSGLWQPDKGPTRDSLWLHKSMDQCQTQYFDLIVTMNYQIQGFVIRGSNENHQWCAVLYVPLSQWEIRRRSKWEFK